MTPRVPHHLAAILLIAGVARADLALPLPDGMLLDDPGIMSGVLEAIAQQLTNPSEHSLTNEPQQDYYPQDFLPSTTLEELMPSAMIGNDPIDLSRLTADGLFVEPQPRQPADVSGGGYLLGGSSARRSSIVVAAAHPGAGQPAAGPRPRLVGTRDEAKPLPLGLTILLVALPIALILSVLGACALATRRQHAMRLAW